MQHEALDLYHHQISTCSQKVRLVLAEKGLEFESHIVDLLQGQQHDPEYVKLNPNHVVPTLVHDGNVLIESSLINEYLDDVFPDVAMRSADPVASHAARLWVKQVDTHVHPAAGVVTFAIGPRELLKNQPDEAREAHIAAIPDPAARERRRSVIEHGVDAPEFAGALGRFLDLFDAIEEKLERGTWLSGESFGLADACVLPYVLRLDHLSMTSVIDARPTLADWYARVQERDSYERAVRAWAPTPVVDMFRKNGEAVWPKVEPLTHR
jgi:glutathione S-transferase